MVAAKSRQARRPVRTIRLAVLSGPSSMGGLGEALARVRAEHGPIIEASIYLTSQLQEGAVDEEDVIRGLAEADVVLYDLRGSPDRAGAALKAAARRSGNTLIPVYTTSPDLIGLLRMGDFRLAELMGGPPPGVGGRPGVGGPPAGIGGPPPGATGAPVGDGGPSASGRGATGNGGPPTATPRPLTGGPPGPPAGPGQPGMPAGVSGGMVSLGRPDARPGAVPGAPSGVLRSETSGGAFVDSRRLRDLSTLDEKLASFLPPAAARQARLWVRLVRYWSNGGRDNLANLLLALARAYGDAPVRPGAPVIFPTEGYVDVVTGERLRRLADYEARYPRDPARPTVGVVVYGGTNFESCLQGTRPLVEEIAKRANVLAMYSDGITAADAIEKLFFRRGRPLVDAVVSTVWFRLSGGPLGGDPAKTLTLLRRLDVPLFVPVTMHNRQIAEWRASPSGVAPNEALNSVTLPELDGGIEPVPLFGLAELGAANEHAGQTEAIPERVERIAARVVNRALLRYVPNAEKRVAIILYNYPPGEVNLGDASYLDTLQSVEALLRRLKDEGYTVELPEASLKEIFLGRGLLNTAQFAAPELTARHAIRVSPAEYSRWFDLLPGTLQADVIRDWGEPPGAIMADGTDLLIPGVRFGNVLVALQPTRGVHEDPDKVTHDIFLPPHHQYVAFYAYLREGFGAHIAVHVGTHGTIEFMPGKEIGLSAECAPDALIGDLPHTYLYHVTNPSEAMLAKRRTYAQLVNHASPAFARAELYDDYLKLEDLVNEYEHLKPVSAERAAAILDQLSAEAARLTLDFHEVEELTDTLHALKRAIIPVGLHVLGDRLEGDTLAEYLTLLARYDRGDQPALHRLLAGAEGLDYDAVLDDPPAAERIERRAREVVRGWLAGDESAPTPVPPALTPGPSPNAGRGVPSQTLDGQPLRHTDRGLNLPTTPAEGTPLAALGEGPGVRASPPPDAADAIRTYLLQVAANVRASDEMGALVRALDGGYVLPNLAGDPVRSPETYPVGSNSYQFDPRLVPTESAAARGAEIVAQTLARFHEQEGRYPESVGLILWGFETAKTYGETVGQILAYLGLRVNRGMGWNTRIEPIPLEQLGRPRIDVTVNMCGFFRDLFPNLVQSLDRGFKLVAGLDEPPELNYLRAHALAAQAGLEAEGMGARESAKLASARLFGPRAGEYGNRLAELIETSHWQSEDEFARLFIDRQSYLYGDGLHAYHSTALFEASLRSTEVVSQVRDAHDYEIADLDHYFEYLGGLTKSTEVTRGAKPMVVVADTTRERIRVVSAAEAIKQGVVTRLLNPKWIDGMLEHEHTGGHKISDRVDNLLGLAATTGGVDDWTWSRVAERYIFDEAMLRRLLENNAYAAENITRRLDEAHRRGYWQATPEELAQLRERYLEIEGEIEGRT